MKYEVYNDPDLARDWVRDNLPDAEYLEKYNACFDDADNEILYMNLETLFSYVTRNVKRSSNDYQVLVKSKNL